MKTTNKMIKHAGIAIALAMLTAMLVFGVKNNMPENIITSGFSVEKNSDSKCLCKIEIPYKYINSLSESTNIKLIVDGHESNAVIESVDSDVVKEDTGLYFYAHATIDNAADYIAAADNAGIVLGSGIDYLKQQIYNSIAY
ncbi:MAG: hypothetical protein J6T70_07885 [Bacteroidales bacterium]|nr:hypothetical protein [Bacteroidales bacterium]